MGDGYLPFVWNCTLHDVPPDLTAIGFDEAGDIYVQGVCPVEGHTTGITIPFQRWVALRDQSIEHMKQLRAAPRPIKEHEIVDFVNELDQSGFWDELEDE